MNDDVMILLATFPDGETARQIGTTLVREQLAACVNLLHETESIYRWDDQVERDTEVAAIIKTTADAQAKLIERLIELHPYEVPEALAIPVADGAEDYLKWLRESVKVPEDRGTEEE